MDNFTRDGLTFDVIDSGPSDGDVVLLLHGFPQTGSSWSKVTSVLNDHGFRTIAPTQRGYSPGARPRGRRAYRISELTEDAAALIDRVGRGPVHLVGHDWGSAVAWSLAASRPDLVRTFTSVSVPHPGAFIASMTRSRQLLESWYMFAFQVPRLPEYLVRHNPDRFESLLSKGGLTAEEAAVIRRDVVDTGALTGGMNWYRAMMLGAPSDLKRRVRVPTTHVWSDGDFALDRAGAELAGRYVTADYRLVVFEGVSHWIPDQRPAELADVILDRIGHHSPAAG